MNLFTAEQESYIQHEVKIRSLEGAYTRFEETFKRLESKIDSHFKWTIGTILMLVASMGTMVGGVMLSKYIENHQSQIKVQVK